MLTVAVTLRIRHYLILTVAVTLRIRHYLVLALTVACRRRHCLRIDNSRRGAIHVLCDISRTKIAITSCDRSNKRAYFSACVGANGILMKFDLKKRQF